MKMNCVLTLPVSGQIWFSPAIYDKGVADRHHVGGPKGMPEYKTLIIDKDHGCQA
jgi:hypothetical protein